MSDVRSQLVSTGSLVFTLVAFRGTTFTFSKNCIYGLIGRCFCWRCRGVEPEEEDDWWPRVARRHSELFRERMADEGRR